MQIDRHGYELTTSSPQAAASWVEGADRALAADGGALVPRPERTAPGGTSLNCQGACRPPPSAEPPEPPPCCGRTPGRGRFAA